MGIADELHKLRTLHTAGELTDEEYARAKAAVLDQQSAPLAEPIDAEDVPVLPNSRPDRDGSPNFRLHATIGLVAVFVIAVFSVFLPRLERGWDNLSRYREESQQRRQQQEALRAKPGLTP